jgi:hypothetical protein
MALCGWHECSNKVAETAGLGPEDFCSDACRSRFVAAFDAGYEEFRARLPRRLPVLWLTGPGIVLWPPEVVVL